MGEEVGELARVCEDSVGGEDVAGGGGELAWKGCWEKCISSTAWSSATNSALNENWVNTESKLVEDEADERRLSPGAAESCLGSDGCELLGGS